MNLLERAKSTCDQAEVFAVRRKSTHVRLDEGSLALIAQRNDSSCALRVLKGGKLGASFGESPSQDGLLDDALAAASFGQDVKFGFASNMMPGLFRKVSVSSANLSAEDIVDLCMQLKGRILQESPDAEVNVVCESESGSRRIETTEGTTAEEAFARTSLSVELPFPNRGTDTGAAGQIISKDFIDVSDTWIKDIVEQRSWGEHASSPSTGRLPVILAPSASNLLTFALSFCLEGSAVSKGVSPLRDKVGSPVLSSHLTIQENAQEASMPYTRSFDDEGIVCQPRTIIEQGVLQGFLTDLSSAAELGHPSTGNAARRTMFSEKMEDMPTPSFLGAIIEAGSTPWRELVSDLEEGILVTRMLGLHSSNLMQGQFAVQANGFHVRRGKIVGYLERTMMSGNLFENFLNVRAISQEREPTALASLSVPGLAPYIVLDSVQVTVG